MKISRRNFLKTGAIAAAGLSMTERTGLSLSGTDPKVRIGIIGAGKRGSRHLHTLLLNNAVEIIAICDTIDGNAQKAANLCVSMGGIKPAVYSGSDNSFQEMIDREKPDAVIIASYWDTLGAISLYAVSRGIFAGVELPGAISVEESWKLVEASEKSGAGVMLLENNSFRKENLALLNMKRAGLFGEIVYCEGEFSDEWVDFWFFDSKTGEPNWAVDYLKKYNRDQFPGPAAGPLLGWMDINRGDVITEIYSTATESKAINTFFRREFGADFNQGKLKYKQGDQVTSVLKTSMGKTLILNSSLQLPVPETKNWKMKGTGGIYDRVKTSVHLSSKTPGYHRWEPFGPYGVKYSHKWWETDHSEKFNEGSDYVMLDRFVNAVRSKGITPFDVYDSAVISSIVELSGISIEKGVPVPFPDFTRGKWQTNIPSFGIG